MLRLCLDDELTNLELAARLACDPSTAHYHASILLDAGFLERATPRHSPKGALEKPYRATGLSWTLDLGTEQTGTEQTAATQAMLDAFSAEFAEAGPESVESSSRFSLHLDADAREEMLDRIISILDEYQATDDERRRSGQPQLGGLFVLHRIAQTN